MIARIQRVLDGAERRANRLFEVWNIPGAHGAADDLDARLPIVATGRFMSNEIDGEEMPAVQVSRTPLAGEDVRDEQRVVVHVAPR